MPPEPPDPAPPDTALRRRLEAVVTGRVQGVGYRYFLVRAAAELGVDGWVRNEPDGSVRCVAEGPDPALEALLGRLQAGPSGARVDGVAVAWRPPLGERSGMHVRSGGHPGD